MPSFSRPSSARISNIQRERVQTPRRLLHGGREAALSTRARFPVRGDEFFAHISSLQENLAWDRPATPKHVYHVGLHTGLRDALLCAIDHGSPAQIAAAVQQGAPLEGRFYDREGSGLVNVVDWAALRQRFAAAVQLLELGQNIPLAGETTRAVNAAAEHGHMSLLRKLLMDGASAGQKNRSQESSLHVAVRAGHVQAAALLLQHGAWLVEERKADVVELAHDAHMLCVLDAAGVHSGNKAFVKCELMRGQNFAAAFRSRAAATALAPEVISHPSRPGS
mmetsp:Transcript_59997/g.110202  ORF Transcript_59997/g.110202 Transcript_59997/m.110202 type:complete len:279 (-) Transcript_59997:189-1025(-)